MFNIKEKKQLHQYGMSIKKICKIAKLLNQMQQERLFFFVQRALDYCKRQTVITYSPNVRLRKKELIPNDKEVLIYTKLFVAFNNLANEVKTDNVLNENTKKELNKLLSYIIGHLRGKQNIGNNYGESKKVKFITSK